MANTVLFSLRPAREGDTEYLNSYAFSEGMDDLPNLENVTVAVNAQDEPVGFIRINLDTQGVAYINPIVVNFNWRGYGVGRALVDSAFSKYGELRLVSRGSSKPFYDALGFEDCDWELISGGVTDDCSACTFRSECHPQPMRRLAKKAYL